MSAIGEYLTLERCSYCNIDKPSLTLQARFDTTDSVGLNRRMWGAYACKRCGGVTTASSSFNTSDISQIFPSATVVDESIPGKSKQFLTQALDTLHAPSGSVMLSASAIDAMLKEKGYKNGSLYARIDKASADHLITTDMAIWAHEVRLDANDERHADEDAELPNEADARKVVDFALALAQFLFVLPSRVERGLNAAKASGKSMPPNTKNQLGIEGSVTP